MSFPPLTIKLLWATFVLVLLSMFLPPWLVSKLVLWPIVLDSTPGSELAHASGDYFMPWQIATHVLRFGPWDLLFIGFTLAFFGAWLEESWGRWRYTQFLLCCVAGSGIGQLLLLTVGFQTGLIGFQPAGGADGVMYGILFATAYMWPHRMVNLIIPPVSMELRWLVLLFASIRLVFAIASGAGSIVALGFLFGVAGGWLHIRWWQGRPPFGRGRKPPPPKKPKPNHLRSVN